MIPSCCRMDWGVVAHVTGGTPRQRMRPGAQGGGMRQARRGLLPPLQAAPTPSSEPPSPGSPQEPGFQRLPSVPPGNRPEGC